MLLENAGYSVTPADRVPGLWNVADLARDITTNQLRQLAREHGKLLNPGGATFRMDPGP
ncbi:MAG: hypothetical protein K2W91_14815 [Novosphingobium sp.]|nr:hypothetical protein [Novosphingobium sp.]